jgi:UDP-N-acetyl-D-glucosamine dehydrogenase
VTEKKRFTATTDVKQIKKLDAVIICVPTPLGKDKEPDISYIREAVTGIKDNIKPGQIIILESITPRRTTREILLPMRRVYGTQGRKEFLPGFLSGEDRPGQHNIQDDENTPKVIAGLSPKPRNGGAAL